MGQRERNGRTIAVLAVCLLLLAGAVLLKLPFYPSGSDGIQAADLIPLQEPYDDTRADAPEAGAPEAGASQKGILLVNADNPLPEGYRPGDLVNLHEQPGGHFSLAGTDIRLSGTVYEAMDALFAAAQEDGIGGFIITSGYRSRAEQQELYDATTDGTAARPGASEHETGLAFDVGVRGSEGYEPTPQYEWLFAHCAEYGFILRYPQGKEHVTGIPYEPWHYRYVGVAAATEIMDRGITLEEYLEERR